MNANGRIPYAAIGAALGLGAGGASYLLSGEDRRRELRRHWLRNLLLLAGTGAGAGALASYLNGRSGKKGGGGPSFGDVAANARDMLADAGVELVDKAKGTVDDLKSFSETWAAERTRGQLERGQDPEHWTSRVEQIAPALAVGATTVAAAHNYLPAIAAPGILGAPVGSLATAGAGTLAGAGALAAGAGYGGWRVGRSIGENVHLKDGRTLDEHTFDWGGRMYEKLHNMFNGEGFFTNDEVESRHRARPDIHGTGSVKSSEDEGYLESIGDAIALRESARSMGLDLGSAKDMPDDELKSEYNGVGPDSWDPAKRARLSRKYREFLPAVLVHDSDYARGGNPASRVLADERLRKNLGAIIDSMPPAKRAKFNVLLNTAMSKVDRSGRESWRERHGRDAWKEASDHARSVRAASVIASISANAHRDFKDIRGHHKGWDSSMPDKS